MTRTKGLSLPVLLVLPAALILAGSCTSDPPETTAESESSYASDEERDRVPKDGAQALEWLLEGNRRFVDGRPRHDFASQRRRMMLTEGQHPFGVVLGCADSRVPPELIFDFGLGDLFVIRVAGNVVANDEAGSIEYAIAHLDVPLLLVLGHEGCGAVTAALGEHDGELRQVGGRWHFEAPGLSVEARNLGPDTRPGPAAMGVRPEGLSIGTGPIEGVVQLVEQTGHENITVVRVGKDLRMTGRTAPDQLWRAGAPVQIGVDADQAHFFAAGPTGRRLNKGAAARNGPVAAPVTLREATS